MNAQCNRCRFWKFDESTVDELDANWGFGSCRRKPPRIIDSLAAANIIPPRYGDQSDLEVTLLDLKEASRFPTTFATDWCGEHASLAGAA